MNVSTHAVLADAKSQPMRVCVIFASIIGNALERYDFTVYAFLATMAAPTARFAALVCRFEPGTRAHRRGVRVPK